MSMRNGSGSERATGRTPSLQPAPGCFCGRPAPCVTARASDSVARNQTVDSCTTGSTCGVKTLSKLTFQFVLAGFSRTQELADLEVVEGAVAADVGSNQDVGRRRLELLA